jgi:glucosylglycerate phosphorylase
MQEHVRPRLRSAIFEKLRTLYGDEQANAALQRLDSLIATPPAAAPSNELALSERDALIIAYGDHVRRAGEPPLVTLRHVLKQLALPVSGVHVLPFYPYSSDDGFSVIDYYQVDPALGTWEDIRALSEEFRVMFDAVFNHVSKHSDWFQAFLRGEAPYTDYFTVTDPSADLSLVMRPRTLPLLTPFDTANGRLFVWTTFSDDQIDLNFANPDVLLAMIDVLLFYVQQGAAFIRLDAIAFLWKRIGTTCVHLPETHLVIQLMRDVLDIVAPQTILITETNVPHRENISYFGDGENEAQMVYQFPLPPLILHTLHNGDATSLTRWAATIQRVSDRTTFFNFTGSHDGIGVRPAVGILTDAEITALVERTVAHGGLVSYKSNPDETESPYELNITYFDAINHPDVTAASPQLAIDRFMVSQAIMLAFIGVPGIYLHSLFGIRNDLAGVAQTGRSRTINREKLDADALLAELTDPASLSAQVFNRYRRLLEARTSEPAFHPLGTQTVLDLHPQVFALERVAPDGTARALALHNVSNVSVQLALPFEGRWADMLGNQTLEARPPLTLAPYQVLWLTAL